MNEENNNSHDTRDTRDTAIYKAIKRLAIPESLMPVKDIPELLVENRRICMEMAKQVMQQMAMLATYFGVPLMEIIFNSIPEEADQENLEADGIREGAAAKTYFDLKGAVSLTDICKGMHASKAPALKFASAEMVERGAIRHMCNADPSRRDDDDAEVAEEQNGTTPQEESAEDDAITEEGTSWLSHSLHCERGEQ